MIGIGRIAGRAKGLTHFRELRRKRLPPDKLARASSVLAALALLAALAAVYAAWPIWRAGFPLEIDPNEAWNAYQADAAVGARPLYPGPAS